MSKTKENTPLVNKQETLAETDQNTGNQVLPFIVGVGASAGGLEALQKLFDSYEKHENMSFVIVQHLSPDYKSLMVELLSKHTQMEVFQVQHGLEVRPNCVYVMPSKKNLTIKNRRLYLSDKPTHVSINFPIDIFFHSLGLDLKDRAIAIILSGTGTDGSRGIKTIKENGGIVMVQEPGSAKFNGMPISAMATNLVDYILNPRNISLELHALANMSHSSSQEIVVRARTSSQIIHKILRLLQDVAGIDFTLYKPNTIFRRIDRRIKLNKLGNIEDYYEYIQEHPRELETLNNDLLIGVTQFFRDPDAFTVLEEEVIPAIFKSKEADQQIRIWTPGCSTGEEAYSLAILFEEYKVKHGLKNSVKIFATDIDPRALDVAGNGEYPVNIAVDIQPNYLNKYFSRQESSFTIIQELRNQIVFARHNILADPPFNRVDLVVCRNLLIYLDSRPQAKILSVFQFALNKEGFLFLGPSESIGEISSYMRSLNKRWKIYQSTGAGRTFLPDMIISNPLQSAYPSYAGLLPSKGKRAALPGKLLDSFKEALVDRFSPMAAFVNIDMEVLYLAGGINKLIRLPEKHLSLSILKMLPESMMIPLSTAARKVVKTGEPVRYDAVQTIDENDQEIRYDLQIEPLNSGENLDKVLLISVHPRDYKPRVEGEKPIPIDEMASQRIGVLEQQLKDTRDSLQSTIEELETSNEELQASNEELMAANEELQSTNEELQSVNEELHTVNSELQAKISELTEMTHDMDNLLKSSDIGTIFLDKDLRIRKFTPAIREQFNFIEQDIGRPISHFNTALGDVDVISYAKGVLISGKTIEKEIAGKNEIPYLMKLLPYKTDDAEARGVIITFTNVESFKKIMGDST